MIQPRALLFLLASGVALLLAGCKEPVKPEEQIDPPPVGPAVDPPVIPPEETPEIYPMSYLLVTDGKELGSGDRLLIVSADGTYVMGAQKEEGYRVALPVTVTGGRILDVPEGAQVVTLSGFPGRWNLQVEDGLYLASQGTSKALMQTVEEVSPFATWTIEVKDGLAVVKSHEGTMNRICFNSAASALFFSCYIMPKSHVKEVSLYKEHAAYDPSEDPVRTKSDYGCYLESLTRVFDQRQDQLVRYYDDSGKLTFVIVNSAQSEQLEISGYDTSMKPGSEVMVDILYKKGLYTLLSSTLRMHVAKAQGDTVWLGDGSGNGFIIRR